MEDQDTLPPPATENQTPAPETIGNHPCFNDVESRKRGSSAKWTDEKHSLYLESMEACFVNQLYDSLDRLNSYVETECSSDSTSSCRQFKVLQNGFGSRIGSRRKNLMRNEANRPDVSLANPWIQHFRNGNKQGATAEKPSLTSCSSNTEVIDQNFVEEDFGVQMMNTSCNKKRKTAHISCNRNH